MRWMILLACVAVAACEKPAEPVTEVPVPPPSTRPSADHDGHMLGQLPPDHPPIGPGSPAIAGGVNAPPAGQGVQLVWTLPDGWVQAPGGAMRVANLRNAQNAEIAVTRFPGDVGGPLANVNRWRAQIGLPPIDDTQLKTDLKKLDAAGGLSASMVELHAPDGRTTLAAFIPVAQETWFLKLTEPKDRAAAARDDFIAIVKSLRKP